MPNPTDAPDPLAQLVAECVARHAREGRWPLEEMCARHPEFAEALRARIGELDLELQAGHSSGPSQVTGSGNTHLSLADRLRRLGERGAQADRYELKGEVARGGMGAILRAVDQDLGRSLAMKVILTRPNERGEEQVDPQVLERFIEEAQITGQLDHPGVVPVHELGLDASGRAYFTMRLVRGRTADEIFAAARERADGWTPTRALDVLLKVCDTLAYAHSKGVVHRDLKPSNVMVGKYGEVYVMDWGLAKVLGKADARDLRIRPQESTQVSRVRTDRSKETESDPDTALRTMDGAIVGTPCYMPPEQANGQVEDVGARSDVYAAGAMLYTLLAGIQPYVRPGSKTSPYMILEWVRQGPPTPIRQLDPKAPAELVAICERAMARRMEDRYPGMQALADDLRAYLEGRVVTAYRTGARAELLAWMRRNRGMAAGLAAAVLRCSAAASERLAYARAGRVRTHAGRRRKKESARQSAAALAAGEALWTEKQRAVDALRVAEDERELREEAEARRATRSGERTPEGVARPGARQGSPSEAAAGSPSCIPQPQDPGSHRPAAGPSRRWSH
jgi:serine/threonine protein kinase